MENQYAYTDPTYNGSPSTTATSSSITSAHLTPSYPATEALLQTPHVLYQYPEGQSYRHQDFYSPEVPLVPQDSSSVSLQYKATDTAATESVHEEIKSVSNLMKDRRREKNRASQAAFRERRKVVIETLNAKLEDLEKERNSLQSENADLQTQRDELKVQQDELRLEIEKLQEENRRLRTSIASSPSSESVYRFPGSEEHAESLSFDSQYPVDRTEPH